MATKQIVDLEYASPAPSEKFEYRSQSEKQEVVHIEYASPDLSEKFQYQAKHEKCVDTEDTSSYTSNQPQMDVAPCPCGLFEDEHHWKKKDWAAAVAIGVVTVACLVLVVRALRDPGGSRRDGSSFIHVGDVSAKDSEHKDCCDVCVDAYMGRFFVPCCLMCGIHI